MSVQGANNSYSSPQPIAEADTNRNVDKNIAAGAKAQEADIGIAKSFTGALSGGVGGAGGGDPVSSIAGAAGSTPTPSPTAQRTS